MEIEVEQLPEPDRIALTFGHARITLARSELEALVLKAVKLLPGLLPDVEVKQDEDVYRIPALRILGLTDRDIQLLLREVNSDDVVACLWYLDNEELANRIFANVSQRTREALQGDMKNFAVAYARQNDRLKEATRRQALDATKRVVEAMYRLGEGGYIDYA
jgi:hypothetical protein